MDEEVEALTSFLTDKAKKFMGNNQWSPSLLSDLLIAEGYHKLMPLDEDVSNKLIEDLQKVDHHQVSEEIWRIKDYFAKYGHQKEIEFKPGQAVPLTDEQFKSLKGMCCQSKRLSISDIEKILESQFRMVEGITVLEGEKDEHYVCFKDLAQAIYNAQEKNG